VVPAELDGVSEHIKNYYNNVHELNGAGSFEQNMVRQIR
jgi:hypothetical protein